MLQQEATIKRVRRKCRADERLAAAMTYGSFAQIDARLGESLAGARQGS